MTETQDGTMHVTNASPDDVQAAYVLRVTPNGGAIVKLGALPHGATRDLAVPAMVSSIDAYVAEARQLIRDRLVASGLKDDVAQAMVDTWTRSWFRNLGLRVLYVAPRKWADQWLPTTVSPAPAGFVRTLVGRIETLLTTDESALLAQIQANAPHGVPLDLATLGRFAEPRLRRALEMVATPAERAYTQALLDSAHAQP